MLGWLRTALDGYLSIANVCLSVAMAVNNYATVNGYAAVDGGRN